MRFPHFPQLEHSDCGPVCLKMILKYLGKNCDLEYLRSLTEVTRAGVSMGDIARAATQLGFRTAGIQATVEGLKQADFLPCILHWKQNHFVVLYRVHKGCFYLADPAFGKIKLKEKEFMAFWNDRSDKGNALVVLPSEDFEDLDLPYTGSRQARNRLLSFARIILDGQGAKLGLIAAVMLLSMILVYIFPETMRIMIDEGIKGKKINIIFSIVLFQMAILVGQSLLEWLRGLIRVHFSMQVSKKMISRLLLKIVRLPVSFFDSRVQSDTLQKIDEQDRIEFFLSQQLIQALFSFVLFIGLSTRLLLYHPLLAALYLGLSGFSFCWIFIFFRNRRSLDYYSFKIGSENRNHLIEMIQGMVAIKLSDAHHHKIGQWEAIRNKLYKLKLRSLNLEMYLALGVSLIGQLKVILITFLCARWVLQGSITMGEMLSIGYIVGALGQPFDAIVAFFRAFQDARISYDRVDEIYKHPEENDGAGSDIPSSRHSIILDGLYFKYPGGNTAHILKDISIVIPRNKITAIVGASGSGKTTLLKMLLKFYPPTAGAISLGAQNLDTIEPEKWRTRCGVVMQDGFIFSGSIGDNISMEESSWDPEKVRQAAQIACLDEFIEGLPMNYHTRIGNTGSDLSGGQKQRLLIARAVYRNPDYIFFDEATSSLDATNERMIIDNLNQFFKGKTVVIIAHRLSTVKNADQIIVLENGRVTETGSHEALKRDKGRYFELVKNQLELGN